MFSSFFSHMQQPVDAWRKMNADQLARLEAFGKQIGEAEQQAIERTTGAVDEGAKMLKNSVGYLGTLSSEWRKLGLDVTRQWLTLGG